MTQYAQFDPAVPQPAPVIGWYDTAAVKYLNLPHETSLVVVTPEQWAAHYSGLWAIKEGELVPSEPPPVSSGA